MNRARQDLIKLAKEERAKHSKPTTATHKAPVPPSAIIPPPKPRESKGVAKKAKGDYQPIDVNQIITADPKERRKALRVQMKAHCRVMKKYVQVMFGFMYELEKMDTEREAEKSEESPGEDAGEGLSIVPYKIEEKERGFAPQIGNDE